MSSWWCIAFLVAAAGCYAPTPIDCRVRCGVGDACPEGTVCSAGFCNRPGSSPTACCGAPSGGELFVAASYRGPATGSSDCPFPTITAGIAAARVDRSPSRTLHVAAGRYDAATGEKFPLVVRGPIALVGAGPELTIIEGVGQFDHTAEGGTFGRCCGAATIIAGDDTALQRISGMTLRSGRARDDAVGQSGIFCDRGNAAPIGAAQPPVATLTVDHVRFETDYHFGITVTNSYKSGCHLALTASTFDGTSSGLWVIGEGTGLVGPNVAATIGGRSAGNQFVRVVRAPIEVWDGVAQLTVEGNRFEQGGAGIIIGQHDPRQRTVIVGNTFANLASFGVAATISAAIERLEDNTFEGLASSPPWITGMPPGALVLDQGAYARNVRRNRFFGNDVGVVIAGAPITAARPIDLGAAGDPGNNVFACNSRQVGAPGFDVWVDVGAGSNAPLLLAGNRWDRVPPALATARDAANGTDLVNSSRPTAPALTTTGAKVAGIGCPMGRTP